MKRVILALSLIILNISIATSYNCVTDKQNSVIPECTYLENFSDSSAIETLSPSDNSDDSSSSSEQESQETPEPSCYTATRSVCTLWILWCWSWGTESYQVCN